MADRRPRAGRFTTPGLAVPFAVAGRQARSADRPAAPTSSRHRHDPTETRPSRPDGPPRPLRLGAVAGVFVGTYVGYPWTEPGPAIRSVATVPYAESVPSSVYRMPAPGSGGACSDLVATHSIAAATLHSDRQPDGAPPPDRTVDPTVVLTRRTTCDRGEMLDHPVAHARFASTLNGWRAAALLNGPLQP